MKVSINKKTGVLIESSSSNTDETMIYNAVSIGHAEVDVEIREVSAEEHQRLIAERNSINAKYSDLRREAYPSIAAQLDMMYHDAVNGTSTWMASIQAVKAKYPKEA